MLTVLKILFVFFLNFRKFGKKKFQTKVLLDEKSASFAVRCEQFGAFLLTENVFTRKTVLQRKRIAFSSHLESKT